MWDGPLWAERSALQGKICGFRAWGAAGDDGGPWGMSRMMSHDARRLVRRCMISTTSSPGGPCGRNIVPYSPSGSNLPRHRPS